MTDKNLLPKFSGRTAHQPVDVLRGYIYSYGPYAHELIGIFVTNVLHRHADGSVNEDFLNYPTPIDGMDQSRLLDMKLIIAPRKRFLDDLEENYYALTSIGRFVVEHARIIQGNTEGSSPKVDEVALQDTLAHGFAGRTKR